MLKEALISYICIFPRKTYTRFYFLCVFEFRGSLENGVMGLCTRHLSHPPSSSTQKFTIYTTVSMQLRMTTSLVCPKCEELLSNKSAFSVCNLWRVRKNLGFAGDYKSERYIKLQGLLRCFAIFTLRRNGVQGFEDHLLPELTGSVAQ